MTFDQARDAIEARRKALKLSRYTLAQKANINRQSLGNTLNRSEDMRLSTLAALVEALGGTLEIRWQ